MSFDGDKSDESFNIINSYFIGPKASNLPDFRANVNAILDELQETRLDYYPEDNVCFLFLFFKVGKIQLTWTGT